MEELQTGESGSAFLTLQFAVRHQRSTESDSTNVGAQVGNYLGEVGCRVRSKVRVLDHVFGHTGEYCSQSDQAVECSHKLRQVSDLNFFCNGQAWR